MDPQSPAPSTAVWRPLQDAQTGDFFWYNTVTGECQWEAPEGVDPNDAHLNQWTWQKFYDDESNQPYWHNTATGASTWKNPEWIKAIDDDTERPYWYNLRCNKSTWEEPSDYVTTDSSDGEEEEQESHHGHHHDQERQPPTTGEGERKEDTVDYNTHETQSSDVRYSPPKYAETQETVTPTNTPEVKRGENDHTNHESSRRRIKKVSRERQAYTATRKKAGKVVTIDTSFDEEEEESAKEKEDEQHSEKTQTENGKKNKSELKSRLGFTVVTDKALKSRYVSQCFKSPQLSENFRLFWDASPQEHSLASNCLTLVKVQAETDIIKTGDIINSVILPVEGTIQVHARGGSYEMDFGEVLHEKALLSHECFHSEISANAKTDAYVLFFRLDDAEEHFGNQWLLQRRKFLLECNHKLSLHFLHRIEFFKGLHEDKLNSIADTLRIITRSSRESLLIEGTPGDAFFILVHGEVKFTEHGKQLSTAGPGSYFGEISLFKDVPVSASCSATEDCILLVQHRKNFISLVSGTPGMKSALQEYIASHAANSIRGLKVGYLSHLSEERLAHLSKFGKFSQHPANTTILKCGSYDGNCYVITHGVVKVTELNSLGKTVVTKYASGDCINYEVLASSKPRTLPYTVETAVSGATTISFQRHDIRKVFADDESLLHTFELTILGENAPIYKLVRHQEFCDSFGRHCRQPQNILDILVRLGCDTDSLLECFWELIISKNTLSLVSQSSAKLLDCLTAAQEDARFIRNLTSFRDRYLYAGCELAPFVSVNTVYTLGNEVDEFLAAASKFRQAQDNNENRMKANETYLSAKRFEEFFDEFLHGSKVETDMAEFQQTALFRRFLRNNAKQLTQSSSPVKTQHRVWLSPRFYALKQNRVGAWQPRELCFNVNSRELLVYKPAIGLSIAQRLLDIEYIKRVADHDHCVLNVCFRHPTQERIVSFKFDSEGARENFCLLCHLLQSDVVFLDDVFKEDLGTDRVSFKVHIPRHGIASDRRALTIDPERMVITKHKDFDDFKQSQEYSLMKENVRLESSTTELEKLTIVFNETVSPIIRNFSNPNTSPEHQDDEDKNMDERNCLGLVFPTRSLRESFRGIVHALINKLDFASIRAYGINNAEYCPDKLRLFCTTFNCGGSKPSYDPSVFERWINPRSFDIYAIGFQECDHKDEWSRALHRCLNNSPKGGSKLITEDYVTVAQVTLWGIHLFLYAQQNVAKHISNVTVDTVATGVANVLGNKGAVAVGFSYKDTTSFAIVSAHLAARHERVAQRNTDYATIVQSLNISGRGHPRNRLGHVPFIHTFDFVFFLGDLNYRVDLGKPGTPAEFEKVKKLAESQHYGPLIKGDQLYKEMQNGYFSGFTEAPIAFHPTYRLERGTNVSFQNKKNQNASYTDRILYRSYPSMESKIKSLQYTAAAEVNLSDHRPVYSTFEVSCRKPFFYVPRTTKLRNRGSITIRLQDTLLIDRVLGADQLAAASVGLGSNIQREDSGSSTLRTLVPNSESVKLVFAANFLPGIECSNLSTYQRYTEASRPMIKWKEEDCPDLQPILVDPDWLGEQAMVVSLQTSKGETLGVGEIPLENTYMQLVSPAPQTLDLTLSFVLTHPLLLKAFKQHLHQEHAIENLQFYQAVQDFKKKAILAIKSNSFEQLVGIINGILEMFINKDAPNMVNLSSTVYHKLTEDVEALREHVSTQEKIPFAYTQTFNDAQSEIFRLMQRDNFPRFLKLLQIGEEENNTAGAPFACSLSRDGVSVGALAGHIRMSSFDVLWDREERLKALEELIERKYASKSEHRTSTDAHDSGDDDEEDDAFLFPMKSSFSGQNDDLEVLSDEDDELMAQGGGSLNQLYRPLTIK